MSNDSDLNETFRINKDVNTENYYLTQYFKETGLFTKKSLDWIEGLDKDTLSMLGSVVNGAFDRNDPVSEDICDFALLSIHMYLSDQYLMARDNSDTDKAYDISQYNYDLDSSELIKFQSSLAVAIGIQHLIKEGRIEKDKSGKGSTGYLMTDDTTFKKTED